MQNLKQNHSVIKDLLKKHYLRNQLETKVNTLKMGLHCINNILFFKFAGYETCWKINYYWWSC